MFATDMNGAARAAGRCLAVVFTPRVPALQLVEVAAGDWRIAWLVDRDAADVSGSLRLLARLGTVVDITGLDDAQSAERLASCAPDGIIAFTEQELMTAARIGARLGLAVNSPETVTRLTNKYAQRKALRAARLPVPRFLPVPADADADTRAELAGMLDYPVVVKPQQGEGSRSVRRVPDRRELQAILDANARSDEPEDLIVEELLPDGWRRDERPYADFVSVESIVAGGRISHLAVTGRARLQEPFLETGNFIPSNIPADVSAEVMDVAGQAITALGAQTGTFHTEIKLSSHGPWVIEVNGRVGGSVAELLALASDNEHSLLRIACRVALGEDVVFDAPLHCSRVGYSLRVPPPVGAARLVRLDAAAALRQVPGVSTLEVMRRAQDPVDWREGWDGCVYFALGTADDHEAMWQARRNLMQAVELEFA